MMILHTFKMDYVEDPYLYAASPIWEWQQTEQGKWVMENVIEPPVFHIDIDVHSTGYRVWIEGKLSPKAGTFFKLKYQ
jgi:hypothetical protein